MSYLLTTLKQVTIYKLMAVFAPIVPGCGGGCRHPLQVVSKATSLEIKLLSVPVSDRASDASVLQCSSEVLYAHTHTHEALGECQVEDEGQIQQLQSSEKHRVSTTKNWSISYDDMKPSCQTSSPPQNHQLQTIEFARTEDKATTMPRCHGLHGSGIVPGRCGNLAIAACPTLQPS
eukprot:6335542-Amphidinium_carterae.1